MDFLHHIPLTLSDSVFPPSLRLELLFTEEDRSAGRLRAPACNRFFFFFSYMQFVDYFSLPTSLINVKVGQDYMNTRMQ